MSYKSFVVGIESVDQIKALHAYFALEEFTDRAAGWVDGVGILDKDNGPYKWGDRLVLITLDRSSLHVDMIERTGQALDMKVTRLDQMQTTSVGEPADRVAHIDGFRSSIKGATASNRSDSMESLPGGLSSTVMLALAERNWFYGGLAVALPAQQRPPAFTSPGAR